MGVSTLLKVRDKQRTLRKIEQQRDADIRKQLKKISNAKTKKEEEAHNEVLAAMRDYWGLYVKERQGELALNRDEQRELRGKLARKSAQQGEDEEDPEKDMCTRRHLKSAYSAHIRKRQTERDRRRKHPMPQHINVLPSEVTPEVIMGWNRQSIECINTQKAANLLKANALLEVADRFTCEDHAQLFSSEDERLLLRSVTLNNTGCLRHNSGKYHEALTAYSDALDLEDVLGKTSPATLLNFGISLFHSGEASHSLLPCLKAAKMLESTVTTSLETDNSAPQDTVKQYILTLHALYKIKTSFKACNHLESSAQRDLAEAHTVAMNLLGPMHPTSRLIINEMHGKQPALPMLVVSE